jgi:hypothetical protein
LTAAPVSATMRLTFAPDFPINPPTLDSGHSSLNTARPRVALAFALAVPSRASSAPSRAALAATVIVTASDDVERGSE